MFRRLRRNKEQLRFVVTNNRKINYNNSRLEEASSCRIIHRTIGESISFRNVNGRRVETGNFAIFGICLQRTKEQLGFLTGTFIAVVTLL